MSSATELDHLRRMARRLIQDETGISDLRRLRDSKSPAGYDRDLWQKMVHLGWAGIVIPERFGGAGLGYRALGAVLEETGRHLTPTPLLSSCVLSAEAVLLAGTEAQRAALLPDICCGKRTLAFAHDESASFSPWNVALRAEPAGDGFSLSGKKCFVLDGREADAFVVTARTSAAAGDAEGLSLFVVEAASPGLTTCDGLLIDSRRASSLEFHRVWVSGERVLGRVGEAASAIEEAISRTTIVFAAEMLGGIRECFERTIAYLKERRQFGVPIGTFQALQHRAARWYCEIELTSALVGAALTTVDSGDRAASGILGSACKARASELFAYSGAEAVQMFGGVGMTDAHEIGFFLKRAHVAEQMLGDASYHRARFADLNGF